MERKSRLCPAASQVSREQRSAFWLALASSFLVTLLGAVYFVAVVCFAAGGAMTMPPPEGVQLFGGVTTALAAVLLPVLFVSLHYLAPSRKRPYTMLGIVFCTLFAAFVGINRFVQLSVVRQSLLDGNTEGLSRFLPYGEGSALFALEMTGWGIMMGLAAFFLAMALGRRGLPGAARYAFFAYTVLALTSGICFILNSPLSVIGFAAWGFVLFVGTGILFFSLLGYDRHWVNRTD